MIHFTLSASIAEELPTLLTGKPPANPSNSTIGTGNFAAPPQALIIGAGFGEADINALQALAEGTPDAVQIPWLWMDASKEDEPKGKPTEEEMKAIGMKVAARMKEALNKLKADSKLGNGNSGLHMV